MPITRERLQEFTRLYEEIRGENLTEADAREMAFELSEFYSLIRQPLPSEIAVHKKELSLRLNTPSQALE